MRNPHNVARRAIVRRVRSCHGSDCNDGPHSFRQSRCLILTRVDYRDGRPSVAWVSGDCAESSSMRFRREQWKLEPEEEMPSERIYRKRHSFDPKLPTWYGGGFWARVEIGPAPWVDTPGADATHLADEGRQSV